VAVPIIHSQSIGGKIEQYNLKKEKVNVLQFFNLLGLRARFYPLECIKMKRRSKRE